MFNFFSSFLHTRKSPRAHSAAEAAGAADPPTTVVRPPVRAKETSAYSRPGFLDRLPVPEVNESCDESVWDEWEHSSMQLDSRMGGLSAHDSVKVKSGTLSQAGELDPFDSVRKKRRT